MTHRNIRLGFVAVALLNGLTATAYIREYAIKDEVAQARCMVNGMMLTAQWNGAKWVQVA